VPEADEVQPISPFAARNEPINGWIGLILFLVFYPAFMGYMQSGLNPVWQAQAAKPTD